ncbi:MAG: ABC transporter substrate-binding protein [Deltaproteobacteria bacterium]|nr:ABC transporter substrate-binding protein [Deltaproteobacteria bacterium]
MCFRASVWLMIFFIPFLLLSGSHSQTAEPPRVRIAHGAFNEKVVALWIGVERGIFRKHGVEVEIVNIRSGPLTMSALASGDIQVAYTIPGSVLSAAAGGLDVVFFAGIVNRVDGDFVVAPGIRKPEDLRGKTVGVQSIGGGVWSHSMLALEHLGLDAARDKILIRVVGDPSIQVQSLSAGLIDAAWLTYAFSRMMQEKGFRVLLDLGKAPIPYQGLALAARRSYLQNQPQIVDSLLRAMLESVAFIQSPVHKQDVLKSLMKNLRLTNVQEAESGYEMLQWIYSFEIRPNLKGLQTMHRLLSTTNPKMKGLRSEDAMDDAPVRRLEKTDFYRGLVARAKK